MSSANLDLVRSLYAAWERGDFSATDWAHPEIEYVLVEGPSPGSWRGVPAMKEAWRDFLGSWEDYRAEVEGYRALDTERVLVLVHGSGRGKTSGVDIGHLQRRHGANLFHIRDGKVTRLVIYFDRERALADLGLTPEKSHDDPR
jgi:ketosteroid isomerase-like protein